jgi:hypothetical protein
MDLYGARVSTRTGSPDEAKQTLTHRFRMGNADRLEFGVYGVALEDRVDFLREDSYRDWVTEIDGRQTDRVLDPA